MNIQQLTLNQYPQAIYKAEVQLVQLRDRLTQDKLYLARLDAEIEQTIAADTTLKNDQQRKAAKLEARDTNDYQLAIAKAEQTANAIANTEAEYNYLRNGFSVAKLEAQMSIAQIDKDMNIRELMRNSTINGH